MKLITDLCIMIAINLLFSLILVLLILGLIMLFVLLFKIKNKVNLIFTVVNDNTEKIANIHKDNYNIENKVISVMATVYNIDRKQKDIYKFVTNKRIDKLKTKNKTKISSNEQK